MAATKDAADTAVPIEKRASNPREVIVEAKRRQRAELEQRLASGVILSPEDIGGGYSAGRALQTVLNGQRRTITSDDLKRFAKLTKDLGKKFAGGITAKQLIELAQPDRRERANTQIHYAVPMEIRGPRLHFTTNAAPGSRAARHNVWVEFLGLSAASASSAKVETLAKKMAAENIKVDCDCEDWRYVFRYVATVGNFNAGRPETGFPKLRNPQLDGVACKHVLRTVHLLAAPVAQRKLAQMIELARGTLKKDAVQRVLKKDAEAMAIEQAARKDWKRSRIETAAERKERLAAGRAVRIAASSPAAKAVPPSASEAERRALVESAKVHIEPLVEMGLMSRAEADAKYALALKGGKG